MIQTSIEIQAPPSLVRGVLLEFPQVPIWNTHGLVQHISPLSENKTPLSLVPGDKLSYKSSGLSVEPTVLTNSDTEFKWGGWVWGLLKGAHVWRFEESKAPENEGGTHFVHEEEFSGLLAGLMGPDRSVGKMTTKWFEDFNADLKERAEALKALAEGGMPLRD